MRTYKYEVEVSGFFGAAPYILKSRRQNLKPGQLVRVTKEGFISSMRKKKRGGKKICDVIVGILIRRA
jgi:hypothetical protein